MVPRRRGGWWRGGRVGKNPWQSQNALKTLLRVQIPVLVCDTVHLLHTLQTLRAEEEVVQHSKMLVPQSHPESVDLAPGRLLGGAVGSVAQGGGARGWRCRPSLAVAMGVGGCR